MTQVFQFLAVLLAAFGLVSLGWLAVGALLLPGVCPARMVVDAKGDGGGLEQTVKALLWLRRAGLWWGEVVIENRGLDEDGAALARALAKRNGVHFSGDDPDHV
ncbi:MAG: hypothetical protein K2M42_07210 [Oscillospiraceae bacterium]|nr:hypothetical protein [Oscillospiraceae bacterium]